MPKKERIFFTKNLRYLVDNSSLNQSELGRILGVSRQGIHRIVVSDQDVRLNTILKIADAYGIDPKDLLFTDLEEKYKNKKLVIITKDTNN